MTKQPMLNPAGYRLTFESDFTKPVSPGVGPWGQHRFDTGDLASHYMTDNSHGNYVCTGDSLILRAKYEPSGLPNGRVWSTGLLDTGASFLQAYGYWEIKCRIPGGKGVWPAFWLMPDPTTNPNNAAEIDLMESIGDPSLSYSNYHWSYNTMATGTTKTPIAVGAWHTIGVQWDIGWLAWRVDGATVKTFPSTNVYALPMYLILNLAIGTTGSWPGTWDATTPTTVDFEVEYVRAWQKS